MIRTMSETEKQSVYTNILYFKQPETLADFRVDMIGNAHFKYIDGAFLRLCAMHLLNIFMKDDEVTDETKKMAAHWLESYPEFTEEVRQVRPELIEK